MSDIALLIFLGYVAFLGYIGMNGGTGALKAHLFLLWFLLIVFGIGFELWNIVRHF